MAKQIKKFAKSLINVYINPMAELREFKKEMSNTLFVKELKRNGIF